MQKPLFFLLLMCILACVANVEGQDYRRVRDGVEHAAILRGTPAEPVRVNVLRLDLTKVRLDVVHAMDAALGTETVSSMVKRHGAAAGINAGFFRLDRSIFLGDASGILQIDGKLWSNNINGRVALGIINDKNKTEVRFGHLATRSVFGFGLDSEVELTGINRERKPDDIILYTPEFHRTTLTDADGTEIVLSRCAERCAKIEVFEGKKGALIPPDGYIISIGKNALNKSNNLLHAARKQPAGRKQPEFPAIVTRIEASEINDRAFLAAAEDIIGGVPQLVKNGKIDITWQQEKSSKVFVETRHPRTAVAKLKDGRLLLVTVDGRQPGYSAGINLPDLAALLLELGAAEAMNLDGGGSTTMVLDGQIVNKPSDKEGERKVGDAILVFPRR